MIDIKSLVLMLTVFAARTVALVAAGRVRDGLAVAGPAGLFIAVVLQWKRGLYVLGHGGVWLGLTLAGIRYRVSWPQRLPDSAVVFCSNHESNVDPPVLFRVLHPQLHILYKAELHKFPIMGTIFDIGGFVPVDRRDRDKALASIHRGAASLRAGNSFLIFPEGTRSRTGHLLPFKKGGFIMAIEAQVPIVPVGIGGSEKAMPKGAKWIKPKKVIVLIGAPLPPPALRNGRVDREANHATTELLHERLQDLFDRAQVRVKA